MLAKTDHRVALEMVLLGVFGQRITVQVAVSDQPAAVPADSPSAPLTLDTLRQELIATFDAIEEPH